MNRINVEYLNTFLAIIHHGGVRKAALALNLTQPAVTARIKNLEGALACILFERRSDGMHLTKRGELLMVHAQKFEHLMELIARDVVDPQGIEGRLRLGVSETIAQCWLTNLVTALHAYYPKLDIEFNVDISINLRTAVLNREIDLAVLLGPISEYSVDNIELPGFDLAWYASKQTPPNLAKTEYLSRPILTYARNTRPFRELRELLFEHIGSNISLFPSSSLSACFRLVAADLGVGVLPRALGQEYVATGQIREFNPGWVPSPLRFTASYLAEPKSHLVETAAHMARDVAYAYLHDKNI